MTPNKRHDRIPDFLIIGAGKSGTTSLDQYLKQHPQIFIPNVKEPNFYGYELVNVESFGDNEQEIKHFKGSVTNLEKYLQLFDSAKPGQVKGETSNTYLYHDTAPERIKHYNPAMKLIAVLRQPAERLHSRYLHLARDNRLPTENFNHCLDQTSIWWKRNDLIKEGFYYKNLSKFYTHFSPSQIRVYLYEDLNKQPEKMLTDIFEFLGVDTVFRPDLSVKFNKSGLIKNKLANKVYGNNGLLQQTIKSILPDRIIRALKSSTRVQQVSTKIKESNLIRPSFDPEIKRRLTQDVYGDDILKLQKLLNRDLSNWLNQKV